MARTDATGKAVMRTNAASHAFSVAIGNVERLFTPGSHKILRHSAQGDKMIRKFVAVCRSLRSDRRAVTALEYGLIASMISVVIISAITNEGRSLSSVFNHIATSL